MMRQTLTPAFLALRMLFSGTISAYAEESAPEKDYILEQVVVLSRHNLRAPLSSNGSVPQELTPHSWISWTANASELTI